MSTRQANIPQECVEGYEIMNHMLSICNKSHWSRVRFVQISVCHEKGTADCGKVSYTLSVIYPDELCEVKQNYGKYKLNEVNK